MAKKDKNPPADDDAMDSGSEGAAESSSAKKGGKLKLIIVVVLAMVIGGGIAFGAMKILGGSSAPKEAVEGQAEQAPAAAEQAPPAEAAPAAGEHGAAPSAPAEAPLKNPPKEGGGGEAAPPAEGGGGEGAQQPAEPAGPQNIEFKPFVVNLNDGSGRRFLKLTMSMQAETPEMADEINAKMPQLRDTILLLLSSLSYDDIAPLDGKLRLRGQILNRINTQLTSGKVKNIYFSDFVVQ